MSGVEDDEDAALVPVGLRASGTPMRKSTNIFQSGKTPVGDTSDMSILDSMQGDEVMVFGGAAGSAEAVHKEVKFAHRLCLVHVLSQGQYPLFKVFRLLFGVACCMLLNNSYYCQDQMTSVFNFFLCVVADDAALQEIKEVMIGGFLGTLSGAGFATLAGYASGVYIPYGFNATQMGWVGPGPMPTAAEYAASYNWNAIWAVAVGVAVVFYVLSVSHLEGATHLQMGAAISSIIAMVLFDFTFRPLVGPLDYIAHPTLFKQTAMNMVTRFISFATAALVALLFYGLLKCLEACQPVKPKEPSYARI